MAEQRKLENQYWKLQDKQIIGIRKMLKNDRKENIRIMGKKGAIKSGGGDVSCTSTPYVPIAPPPKEWHGVASGEACGVYVRVVCGVCGGGGVPTESSST